MFGYSNKCAHDRLRKREYSSASRGFAVLWYGADLDNGADEFDDLLFLDCMLIVTVQGP